MCNSIYRALVVSPTPTWPLNFGNRKRIYSVCNGLKSIGFEVHFVHYASELDWRENMPVESRVNMDEQWDIVDHVYPSIELHSWPKGGEDHTIDEWWDPALENHLRGVLSSRVYDLVVVNYTWLSKTLEFVPSGVLKVLDTHDKFSGRRQLLEANGIAKEYFHTTEPEEFRGLSRADLVWAIKKEEEIKFKEMGIDATLDTLIHLDEVRSSISPFEHKEEGFLTFGFIGARNNINKANIVNFLEIALPIFEKYLPPLELVIAGSVCNDLKLRESTFVKLIGYVERTESFYDAIDVAIIPMEFSTGLKIKAGEALSQGKALLSHAHAMEGYPISHDLHKCSSFEDLALAMCELAYDPDNVKELTAATHESNKKCRNEINDVFYRLKTRISREKNVVCFLPEQFGDENRSLLHWLVFSQMEWLGWRVAPVFISLHKSNYSFYDTRVRYVTEEQAAELLLANRSAVIYNLDENLPDSIRSLATTIFEYSSVDSHQNQVKQSFVACSNSVTVPGFGGIKIPWLSDLLKDEDERSGIVVIGSEASRAALGEFISLFKLKPKESVVEFNVHTFSELDIVFHRYMQRYKSAPRLLVVSDTMRGLNSAEQLAVDLCISHGIKVIFYDDLFDLTSEIDGSALEEVNRNIYSNYFFPHWENAELLIQNSIHAGVYKSAGSYSHLSPAIFEKEL